MENAWLDGKTEICPFMKKKIVCKPFEDVLYDKLYEGF